MMNQNGKTVLCDDSNDNVVDDESSTDSQRQQQENDVAEGSLAENTSIAAATMEAGEQESVASRSMPIAEVHFQQQQRQDRLLRRSLNNDTELMMKIVQERISLAHDGVGEFGDSASEEGDQQSAILACAAAGVPGAYHASATGNGLGVAASRGGDDLLRSSVSSANALSVDCDDLKAGERPTSYYEQAFARASSESVAAIRQEVNAEVVGAIAVGGPACESGPACEERSSCSARTSACSATELETSADLTYTVTQMQSGLSSSTVTSSTFLTGGTQALAVAAEVAPEMLDLERCITSRVRAEIEDSMRMSTEMALENTPVAEIVGRMDRNAKGDQERRRRYRILAACGLLVMAAVTLGVVLGTQKNGYDYPPDNNSIADVPETICYERIPMLGRSEVCPPQSQGSGSTNLVAASRLWNVPEAEISILNAGEVRTDIEQGNFTMGDARKLLTFDFNTLVVIHIKGSKLVTALERGIQKIFDDKAAAEEGLNSTTPSGAFPYGAGIRWNVNMSQPFPRRLSDIQVNPRFERQWQELDLHRVYTIVTNSYLAGGGDAYHEFSSAEDEHVIDTGMNSLESFVEYCLHFGVLLNPSEDHFSTQTYTHDNFLF